MPIIHYTISGNAGAAGVLVSATGAATGSATSAADGTYTIGGLIAGVYTITPTLAGATFTPASLPETIVAGNLTGVNFVAAATGFSSSPTVTDTFHRANAPTLGTNWTAVTGAPSSNIVSNLAAPDSVILSGLNVYTAKTFGNNQSASATIQAFGTSSIVSVVVRTTVAFASGYLAAVQGNGAGAYTVTLSDIATSTTLGVDFTLSGAPSPGDIVTVQASGTLITAFYNGTAIISGTSSSTASGSPALELVATAVQTDTEVSSFTAGPTVSTGPQRGSVIRSGAGFATAITSPQTVLIGTNLGTKLLN